MAHMAVYLRSRPSLLLRASAPLHSASCRSYFSSSSSSSSSSSDSSDEAPQNMENNKSNVKHSFNDVISHLKGSDRQPSQQLPRLGSIFSQGARSDRPSSIDIEELRKHLSSFTRRSADSLRPSGFQDSQGQSPILFQNLYKKMTGNSSQSGGEDTTQKSAIDSIRKNLQNRTPATGGSQGPSTMSLSKLKEALNFKREESSIKDPLQHPVFLNELSEKPKKVADANELFKEYKKDELGEKLRKLRPEGVNLSGAEKDNKILTQRVGVLHHLNGTENYVSGPPKENLVEKVRVATD